MLSMDQDSPPNPDPQTPPISAKEVLKTRQYYNEDFGYIIDSKTKGNLARYINVSGCIMWLASSHHAMVLQHSCEPNLFVQNVFVDTHDLRFPWVAFFAKRYVQD